MKTLDFTPFTEEQFQAMAMYKARGNAWVDIAQYLKLPVEQIQRVAWTHEKLWEHTLTKAERHVARETIGEVVDTLRKDMRYAEPQFRPTIANSLTRAIKQQQEFAPKKRPRPSTAPVTAPVATPAVPATSPVAPEPSKPVEPPALKAPEEPPPKPKLTIEQLLAIQKRVNARAAAVCAFIAFVCLSCLTLLCATPPTSPLVAAPLAVAFDSELSPTPEVRWGDQLAAATPGESLAIPSGRREDPSILAPPIGGPPNNRRELWRQAAPPSELLP